jgi:hypothetical protein
MVFSGHCHSKNAPFNCHQQYIILAVDRTVTWQKFLFHRDAHINEVFNYEISGSLTPVSMKIPAFCYVMPYTQVCSLWRTILNMEAAYSSKTFVLTHQFSYSSHTTQHWSFHWFYQLLYDTINFTETVC